MKPWKYNQLIFGQSKACSVERSSLSNKHLLRHLGARWKQHKPHLIATTTKFTAKQ